MAFSAQGSLFYWSTSTGWSTASGNLVGEILSFNGPTGSAAVIDITSLASTAKEKMMGLPDEGQFSMELCFNRASSGQNNMRASRADQHIGAGVLILNDNSSETARTRAKFKAYVTGYSISGAVDDKVKLSAALEITGGVSWSTVVP